MKSLDEIFPAPEVLLELEPEDIAPLLLRCLNQGAHHQLSRHNFLMVGGDVGRYAGDRYNEVAMAITEAWGVLEREGLIAPEPASPDGQWCYVTKRGTSLETQTDFEAYRRGNLLPPRSLDSTLATKVRPLFLRGDYDTAVFRAFKEVEVRVRAAAGCDAEIGVPLMRKAFHPDDGTLSDLSRPGAERQALSDLFAGAIGMFKNPSSHRDVQFSPEQAADLIRLANYLIGAVDSAGAIRGVKS